MTVEVLAMGRGKLGFWIFVAVLLGMIVGMTIKLAFWPEQ